MIIKFRKQKITYKYDITIRITDTVREKILKNFLDQNSNQV
jgi:hypothetical protein